MSTTQTAARKREMSAGENRDQNPLQPWDDMVDYVRNYVRQEPEVAACICLGVGFILGWKLKPW